MRLLCSLSPPSPSVVKIDLDPITPVISTETSLAITLFDPNATQSDDVNNNNNTNSPPANTINTPLPTNNTTSSPKSHGSSTPGSSSRSSPKISTSNNNPSHRGSPSRKGTEIVVNFKCLDIKVDKWNTSGRFPTGTVMFGDLEVIIITTHYESPTTKVFYARAY
eukprot:TRINITY_DN3562_c0_g1_i9.p1 TRINITY_DN3562_c0_g1~~TRINITY_DN3562_c0_g1_i9.p1  ORF type:complete len:165 (+),score=44.06 TRINITY_DN3562_c0_g1_i9:439-933(+)